MPDLVLKNKGNTNQWLCGGHHWAVPQLELSALELLRAVATKAVSSWSFREDKRNKRNDKKNRY